MRKEKKVVTPVKRQMRINWFALIALLLHCLLNSVLPCCRQHTWSTKGDSQK